MASQYFSGRCISVKVKESKIKLTRFWPLLPSYHPEAKPKWNVVLQERWNSVSKKKINKAFWYFELHFIHPYSVSCSAQTLMQYFHSLRRKEKQNWSSPAQWSQGVILTNSQEASNNLYVTEASPKGLEPLYFIASILHTRQTSWEGNMENIKDCEKI